MNERWHIASDRPTDCIVLALYDCPTLLFSTLQCIFYCSLLFTTLLLTSLLYSTSLDKFEAYSVCHNVLCICPALYSTSLEQPVLLPSSFSFLLSFLLLSSFLHSPFFPSSCPLSSSLTPTISHFHFPSSLLLLFSSSSSPPLLLLLFSSSTSSVPHSCCAPCSGSMIKELIDQGIDVTILWYNPNIQPKQVSTILLLRGVISTVRASKTSHKYSTCF